MYEMILTVLVSFSGPVAELDGHGVNMVSQRYVVAVQGFTSEQECMSFAGYQNLESSLTSSFGAQTKIIPESKPRCQAQPASN